jgi:hypothetical protein
MPELIGLIFDERFAGSFKMGRGDSQRFGR